MIKIAIINDTRVTSHYGCMLVMENLLSLLKEKEVEVVWTWPVSVDWRKHKRVIKSKPKVDAIIVNGEGTIHHSKDRKFAKALAEFARYSNTELNTPSYLINATLFKNEWEEYESLKEYRAIYVRDKGSLKELESFKLDGRYVPDLTFAKNSTEYSELKPNKKIVIIDSAVKEDNSLLKEFATKNNIEFKSMIVSRPRNARFIRSPRPYIKNVIKWVCGDYRVSTKPKTYIQFLRDYELVITGRYHTVSMCIKNQIPFIAIESNTPKIKYLLQDAIHSDSRSININSLDTLDLKEFTKFTDAEIKGITNFIDASEAAISTMINSVVDDIGSVGNYKYD